MLCRIRPGRSGACSRYANQDGLLVRTDPVVLLELDKLRVEMEKEQTRRLPDKVLDSLNASVPFPNCTCNTPRPGISPGNLCSMIACG